MASQPQVVIAPPRSLGHDQRGAIMVVALFMALLLVGLLYAAKGTTESILYKEHLQDAADDAAFEAATLHARSMNAIALTNNVALIGAAVLQAAQLIVDNASSCSAAAQIASPWSECPGVEGRYAGVQRTAEDVLGPVLRAGTRAAEAIRDSTPEVAQAAIQESLGRNFGLPAVAVVLAAKKMPLKTADLAVLCTKGSMWLTAMMYRVIPSELLDPRVFQLQPPPVIDRRAGWCPTLDGVGPQVMDPGNQSGTEPLQVRVLAIGDPHDLVALRRGVAVPEKIMRPTEALPDTARTDALSQYALAQAEYYSEWQLANIVTKDTAADIPEENTFYMDWRARLRRVRIPVDGPADDVNSPDVVAGWITDELAPACRDTACAAGQCGRCASLDLLAPILGAAVH